MREQEPFRPPAVTAEDTQWVLPLLGLPGRGFRGADGTDPREAVLRSMEQIDVAACPGSGKTTLLVAKLAIMAAKWRYRTRGMCVLSHTNAARREIETRLGSTTVGQRLLSYPHFIGTIHGFVNEFLAVPCLRSQGSPIKMIDTDICENRRWSRLGHRWRYSLEQKRVSRSDIRIIDVCFNVDKKNGRFPFSDQTETYRNLTEACREAATEGYYCYDDMFIWANELMDNVCDVVQVIRERFPLLFVDESQDNSEAQSALLHRIFVDGQNPVVRQRLGDSNQAIFDSAGADEASTDRFPDEPVEKHLPNSHRFGQKIADLADPLGIIPYGLVGQGPQMRMGSASPAEGQHSILLFADDSAARVLDAYGAILLETFSERELREGTFSAVGQVHRPSSDESRPEFPRHVGHYWSEYDPELAGRDPTPQVFVQYILAGQGAAAKVGEAYPAVEKIGEAVLYLAGLIGGGQSVRPGRHSHRQILRLLDVGTDARDRYERLISTFAVDRTLPTRKEWQGSWCEAARAIAESIARRSLSGPEVDEFLAWKDRREGEESAYVGPQEHDNIFRYPRHDPKVDIRVGSIHSVKGETHTATLVLETFWNGYSLEKLKPWITGEKKGWATSDGVRQRDRLKIHYVAMTRPTHLVCLAIRRSTFESQEGELDEAMLESLRQRGWQVALVRDTED